MKFDEATIRYPERGVRRMFPKVTATLGEVCSCGKELCWRQLGLKPRKPYLLHVLCSVRILFEQTSYILQVTWRLVSPLSQFLCHAILKKSSSHTCIEVLVTTLSDIIPIVFCYCFKCLSNCSTHMNTVRSLRCKHKPFSEILHFGHLKAGV